MEFEWREFIDSEFFSCSFCFSFNSFDDKLKIDSFSCRCDNKSFYSRVQSARWFRSLRSHAKGSSSIPDCNVVKTKDLVPN
ncbi:hypothetical protein PUN28_009340 [Cardiocondyla obscurior]|uniref:Uncharacterized protein n=1 Tax=Cardiocondyla obscurior TaxID=286306 RepID=A0AAW2FTN9_9HYME